MERQLSGSSRGGFELVELAAAAVVALVVVSLLILAAGDHRRLGRLGEDLAKLRQIGADTAAYGADNSGLYWTYSWKRNVNYGTPYPELNIASTDIQAAANQFAYIIRRRGAHPTMPALGGFIPHILYSHLVLADYLGRGLPDPVWVSAADAARREWSRDPLCPFGPPCAANSRAGYASSFVLPAAFYDQSAVGSRMFQSINHNLYAIPAGASLDAGAHSDVAFPAYKVLLHDFNARHFGPSQPFATQDQSRLPLLFADGAVLVRCASESNPGWKPNVPADPAPTAFNYVPDLWEPPTMSGGATDAVIGRFRWTRGTATQHGLAGRDFGGPETCSGQPGCP